VTKTNDATKHDLECLRLAAELMQLSRDTPDPELSAHCIRMASYWTARVGLHGQQPTASPIVQHGSADHQAAPALPAIILIVERDPLLRGFVVDIINAAEFVALEASCADQAVLLLEARADIAVILIDIHITGTMDGIEFAHAVYKRWPTIRLLLASGTGRLPQPPLPANSAFLEKPYRPDVLLAELRSLVGLLRR
jgi:CheY-like chemotaxis protein